MSFLSKVKAQIVASGRDQAFKQDQLRFMHGGCDAFAIAFQKLIGGEIIVATDIDYDSDTEEPVLVHAVIFFDGSYYDASGKLGSSDDAVKKYLDDTFGSYETFDEMTAEELKQLSGTLSISDAIHFIKKYHKHYGLKLK